MNWELLYKMELENNREILEIAEEIIRDKNREIRKLKEELKELKASKSTSEEGSSLVGALLEQETPITINIYT